MQYLKNKLSPTSVKRKVLAGFSLAFVAILLAYTITHFAFRDMMDTVNEVTAPNEKLTALNHVFQEITTLDQLQRAEAIRNPEKPYKAFLNQSHAIVDFIDSLMLMEWDSAQRDRIASMERILGERDKLFFSYLKLKSNLINNKSLTKRIDTLSKIIELKKVEIDTSVVTTQKKTTTTYLRDTVREEEKDRSFIGRIFSKKKKEPANETTHVKVQEELSVSIDTLAVAKQNKALEEVEKIVHDLEADQRIENKNLLARELELINANSLFITQLLSILHDVEREELTLMKEKNEHATIVVSQSITRISLLLLVFFLGAAVLVYLIWLDISKSNYYRLELERARDEAEELSKIKQRFLANMSHEIRTPLQSIIGFAEQIRHQKSADREAIDAIHSSSEHLLHIVNEVLDYSRISSGSFTFAKENFKLMAVVKEVESAMRIQAHKKALTLLLDLEQTADYNLVGDSFRLRQVLYNILGNAVKFTTKGFVKLSVRTTELKDQVRCDFEITDTGIGIREEDLKKIFNQFEQANTSITRHFGGTGLGLTIVKSLVEAQGGSLQVKSEPGHGTTFTISLTYEVAEEPVAEEISITENIGAVPFKGKILIVDDDPMILRLTSLILSRHHAEHTIYNDPESLLQASVDEKVSHILMDIRMPKMNGVELCQALRKKYPQGVKFVALTAHVFQQEQQVLRDQGFDAVLSKPYHEQELTAILGISAALQDNGSHEDTSCEIDLSSLREMTLNDEALFQSVLNQFIEETRCDLQQLEQKIGVKDRSGVREIVHKLAGRVGQIGIKHIANRLRNIEDEIVKGQHLADLEDAIKVACKEVNRLIGEIQTTAHEPWS